MIDKWWHSLILLAIGLTLTYGSSYILHLIDHPSWYSLTTGILASMTWVIGFAFILGSILAFGHYLPMKWSDKYENITR